MKQLTVAAALFIGLTSGVGTARKPASTRTCGDRGLLLSISVPEGPDGTEAKIPLTFVITNTNNHHVLIPTGFTYARDFDKDAKTCLVGSGTFIMCQRQAGEYLKFKGGYAKASGPGQSLQAGQKLTAFTIDLVKCFDLVPGKYDVQLLFTKRYSGFIDAASNRITITVRGKPKISRARAVEIARARLQLEPFAKDIDVARMTVSYGQYGPRGKARTFWVIDFARRGAGEIAPGLWARGYHVVVHPDTGAISEASGYKR